MSEQGGAGQWRPASSHSGQYSEPDDMTGPMPAVSDDESAAPAFPSVEREPARWSVDEDEEPTGGFPTGPRPGETRRRPSAERAPFEPADPPASGHSDDVAAPPSEEDLWNTFGGAREDEAGPAGPVSSGPREQDGAESTPPFGMEFQPTVPHEAHPSPFADDGTGEYPQMPGESRHFAGYHDESDELSGPAAGHAASDDEPYGDASFEQGAGPEDTASAGSSRRSSWDEPYGDASFEQGAGSEDTASAGSSRRSSWDEPYGDASFEQGAGSEGTASAGSSRRSSWDEPYGETESSGGAYTAEERPLSRDQDVTDDEQAAENEFFAADDHPALWDKVVAPAGPPPQPGKPSSGNLRLPDWMREESQSGRPPAPDGFEEDGGRKKPLVIGVGLLVIGLLAAGGVYFFKGSHSGSTHAAPPVATQPAPSEPPASPPAPESGPPEKVLAQFKGDHTKPAGRIIDQRSGLSYPRLGRPWGPLPKKSPMAETGFNVTQVVVTEKAGNQPKRWGRLMSAALSGVDRDAYAGPGTERAAARQVAQHYQDQMYAFRHKTKLLASQPLDVDGHKGWLFGYYLTYHRPGVKATGDIVTLALVDTGKKAPGVVFMSVPNTHKKLWPDVNYVMRSIKMA